MVVEDPNKSASNALEASYHEVSKVRRQRIKEIMDERQSDVNSRTKQRKEDMRMASNEKRKILPDYQEAPTTLSIFQQSSNPFDLVEDSRKYRSKTMKTKRSPNLSSSGDKLNTSLKARQLDRQLEYHNVNAKKNYQSMYMSANSSSYLQIPNKKYALNEIYKKQQRSKSSDKINKLLTLNTNLPHLKKGSKANDDINYASRYMRISTVKEQKMK